MSTATDVNKSGIAYIPDWICLIHVVVVVVVGQFTGLRYCRPTVDRCRKNVASPLCPLRCGVVNVQKRGVAVLGSNRSLSIITDCRLHCMAAEANCTEMGDFTGYCLHLVFMLLGFYQELWNHRRHVLDR